MKMKKVPVVFFPKFGIMMALKNLTIERLEELKKDFGQAVGKFVIM